MILFAIALLGFAVEGTLGFGSTLIVVSLGAQLVPLAELLPAFIPVGIVLSLSLVRRDVAWRVLGEMAPLLALGMAAGVALARVVTSDALLVAFGAFVVSLAIWKLVGRTTRLQAPLLVLGGIVHGLFGTGGPLVVYVARTKIADKTAFRSTLAVLWIALNVVLLANVYRAPSVHTLEVALALVPGLAIGTWLHRRLDAGRFERVVWLGLLVAGSVLAARAL